MADRARAAARPTRRPSTAVDAAREALLAEVDAAEVGDHLGAEPEADRVATHLFECRKPGYVGWRWSVTVARASRQKTVTVDEIVLIPGPEAIVAPEWVPYRERHQARRPVARRPAARGRRRPAAGPDVLLRRRPARPRRAGPRSAPSPRISASAGSGPSRPRATSWPPSAGTTATPAPTRRSRSPRPSPARPAASWSGWPARWPSPSASAPTATPTTTAASSPSGHGCGAHSEVRLAKRHEPIRRARAGRRHLDDALDPF